MAVNNRMAPVAINEEQNNKAVTYEANGEQITLTPNMIRQFLVRGDASVVTDQEVVLFLNLCRYQKLNPFLREAYLIKYGDNPAAMVVAKDAKLKRAVRNPRYRGHLAGVVLLVEEESKLEYRTGSLVLDGERLVGGWAKVYVDGYEAPIETVVSFGEYVGLKNGQPNKQWSSKPATMIRKVALSQALSEAFPEDLAGVYEAEEMGVEIEDTQPVTPPVMPPAEPQQQPKQLEQGDDLFDAPAQREGQITMQELPEDF